jgi:hypothetical protein
MSNSKCEGPLFKKIIGWRIKKISGHLDYQITMGKIFFGWQGWNTRALVQIMHIFLKEKYKLLAPKLDNLLKQHGYWKVKVSNPNVDVDTFYFNKNLMHV